jgi:AcrR family transcriptional regulator
MSAQLMFRQEPEPTEGLRSRKKVRTRLAIEDAALALFAEQGYEETTVEQIAERAEVSTTTFFRYFPGKADVILCHQGSRLPALRQAILDRPLEENDLVAVQRAFQKAWISDIDAERTARTALAIASSHVLRGLSYDIGQGWLDTVSQALARRRGLNKVSRRYVVAARAALGVFGGAVESWIADGCRDDLEKALERNFETMAQLCNEWSLSDQKA